MASFFEVAQHMMKADNKALQMAPLSNVSNVQKTKRGTLVTIGVGGDIVGKFAIGSLVGGLILIDVDEFKKAKAELESAAG